MEKNLPDIIKAREIIKKKFNAFRHGEQEKVEELDRYFKPVTEPLQAILKNQIEKNEEVQGVVDRQKESVEGSRSKDELYDALETKYGPYVAPFFYDKLTGGGKDYDDTYGLRKDKNKGWMIGNQQVTFNNAGQLLVNNRKYEPTPGFLELIFKKIPQGYTEEDRNHYQDLLEYTSGHRRSYSAESPVNSGKAKKYKDIISEMFPPKSKKKTKRTTPVEGSGLYVPHNASAERVFVYWDDPNELVERLALLVASKDAGHTAHDREILSLVEELREAGYIV